MLVRGFQCANISLVCVNKESRNRYWENAKEDRKLSVLNLSWLIGVYSEGKNLRLAKLPEASGPISQLQLFQNHMLLRKRETAHWGSCLLIYFISSCLPMYFIIPNSYFCNWISLWIFPWLWGESYFTLNLSNQKLHMYLQRVEKPFL